MMILPGDQINFQISIEKTGNSRAGKATFPRRYGKYAEIKTLEYEFAFNLNGEIKFIRGLNVDWPHPAEQLKRTDGNDWVYYTVGDKGGDQGISSWMGEYYLPCLPYSSNPVWEIKYFSNPVIMNAFGQWSQLYANLYQAPKTRFHPAAQDLIGRIIKNNDQVLYERSLNLTKIIGSKISVLPPDTRHADYEVIPLNITDGCLYHCRFCCVKSETKFQKRSKSNIREQIGKLKDYYGKNLENYTALYLGNHDALGAGEELISYAAANAYKTFDLGAPDKDSPLLFLFGSVGSLLKAEDSLFNAIDALPFYTYINIGFESVDAQTLDIIGKPVSAA
ncbi:MAG: radical SAM protein, partial [Desulfobacteraceae bacterium]|nr:radical SAM protein [Desulfobacteraceae bacterium]